MSDALFDSQKFLQSLASDTELARELLAAFMEDSPARVASLGQALDAGDAGQASRLAHSLKGMCGVVRTDILVDLALKMENAAKGGDMATTREHCETFTERLDAAHGEMREFLASL